MRWIALGCALWMAGCVEGVDIPKRVALFEVDNPGWCGECTDKVTVSWTVEPATPVVTDLKIEVEFDGKVVHTINNAKMSGTKEPIPKFCGPASGSGKTGQVRISGTAVPATDPHPLQQSLTGEAKRLDFEPICTDAGATTWSDETGYTENLYPPSVRISRLRNMTYYDLNKNGNFDGSPPDQPVLIDVSHPPNLASTSLSGAAWSSITAAQNTLHGTWSATITAGTQAPGTRCPPDVEDANATVTLVAEAEVVCASE